MAFVVMWDFIFWAKLIEESRHSYFISKPNVLFFSAVKVEVLGEILKLGWGDRVSFVSQARPVHLHRSENEIWSELNANASITFSIEWCVPPWFPRRCIRDLILKVKGAGCSSVCAKEPSWHLSSESVKEQPVKSCTIWKIPKFRSASAATTARLHRKFWCLHDVILSLSRSPVGRQGRCLVSLLAASLWEVMDVSRKQLMLPPKPNPFSPAAHHYRSS